MRISVSKCFIFELDLSFWTMFFLFRKKRFRLTYIRKWMCARHSTMVWHMRLLCIESTTLLSPTTSSNTQCICQSVVHIFRRTKIHIQQVHRNSSSNKRKLFNSVSDVDSSSQLKLFANLICYLHKRHARFVLVKCMSFWDAFFKTLHVEWYYACNAL